MTLKVVVRLTLLWLLFFAPVCFSVGQSLVHTTFSYNTTLIGHKLPEKVKAMRVLVSNIGLMKMRPFVLEKEVFYDEQARVIQEHSYVHEESLFGSFNYQTSQEYKYDEEGRLKKLIKNYKNGLYKDEVEYEYSEEGEVHRVLLYQPDGTVKTIKREEGARLFMRRKDPPLQKLLLYDSMQRFDYAKKVLSDLYPIAPNTINYAVIANGYVIRTVNPEGLLLAERRMLFNENKQVAQVVNSNSGYNNVTITEYAYDSAGNEIEQTVMDGKRKLLIKYSHIYNEKGHLIEIRWSYKRGKPVKIIRYEYDFY